MNVATRGVKGGTVEEQRGRTVRVQKGGIIGPKIRKMAIKKGGIAERGAVRLILRPPEFC
jgi:hypothetical protein